jgi:hypothetical protein
MTIHFDVINDMHRGFLPQGKLVGCGRQRLESRLIKAFEQALA